MTGQFNSWANMTLLQAIFDSHRGCQFVIGGDLNVAKHCNIPAEHAIQQFCSTNNLFWLDPCYGSIDSATIAMSMATSP